jgi:hypothetical protein
MDRERSIAWVISIGMASLALLGFSGSPAHCQLIINPTFDDAAFIAAGYNPDDVHAAFHAAAHQIEAQYIDPVNVNIMVTTMPDGFGRSSFGIVPGYTYSQIRLALIDDQNAAPSPTGAISILSLPVDDPTSGGNFFLTTAQAKALKLSPDGTDNDGTFFFTTSVDWAFDPNNRAVPNKFDFISTAIHEVSEIMGRVDGISNMSNDYTINDLFRYSAPGVRDLENDRKGYLSIDGGVTNLATFAPDGDLEDYAFDPMNPGEPFGPQLPGTPGDLSLDRGAINLDVIGWDWPPSVHSVPEPGSLALLIGLGVSSLFALRRLRRRKK